MKQYLDFNEIPVIDLAKPRLFDGQTITVFESEEEYLLLYPNTIDNKIVFSDIIESTIKNKAIELDYLSVDDVNLFDVQGGTWQEEAAKFKVWQSSLWDYYYTSLDVDIEEFILNVPKFNI